MIQAETIIRIGKRAFRGSGVVGGTAFSVIGCSLSGRGDC